MFGYDEDTMKLYRIRLGELSEEITTINLFLHDDSHYCPITDLSRLTFLQINKSDHGKDICLHCLSAFSRLSLKGRRDAGSKSLLDQHKELCDKKTPQWEVYPSDLNSFVTFSNYERTHPVPFPSLCMPTLSPFLNPLTMRSRAQRTHSPFSIKDIGPVVFVIPLSVLTKACIRQRLCSTQ